MGISVAHDMGAGVGGLQNQATYMYMYDGGLGYRIKLPTVNKENPLKRDKTPNFNNLFVH